MTFAHPLACLVLAALIVACLAAVVLVETLEERARRRHRRNVLRVDAARRQQIIRQRAATIHGRTSLR